MKSMFYILSLCKFRTFAKLRYCPIFKVGKLQSLFNKVKKCLQKTTTCIGMQAEQIFSVNV